MTLLLDNVCNHECNKTICEYDFGSCIDTQSANQECGFIGSGCLNGWIEDGLCDANCYNQFHGTGECGNGDNIDCNDNCPLQCKTLWSQFKDIVSSRNEPIELADATEVCFVWPILSSFIPEKNLTCQQGLIQFDINNDGYISFYESILAVHLQYAMTYQKAINVDCSKCMDNSSLYF